MRHLLSKVRRTTRRLLGRRDPLILMYHRVANAPVDPWRLAVEPRNFEGHMAVLASSRSVVPLDWLVNQVMAGRRPSGAVAITFDDGYLDVLSTAKPILDKYDVPATVFFTTGAFGSLSGFWWDRLANSVVSVPVLPEVMTLSFVPGGAFSTRGRDVDKVHRALWRQISAMPQVDRELAISEVSDALGSSAKSTAAVMSQQDVRALVCSGRITPGAHTVTHPSLPDLDEDGQRDEMLRSREAMETLMGERVGRFAYPFGRFNSTSERLMRELDFDYAVTTDFGSLDSPRQRYRLPRLGMENWSAEQLEVKLRYRL
jgi:peptidoglycan/xylan/chitin deacetylase (PgdA/CDA1 family)